MEVNFIGLCVLIIDIFFMFVWKVINLRIIWFKFLKEFLIKFV